MAATNAQEKLLAARVLGLNNLRHFSVRWVGLEESGVIRVGLILSTALPKQKRVKALARIEGGTLVELGL